LIKTSNIICKKDEFIAICLFISDREPQAISTVTV